MAEKFLVERDDAGEVAKDVVDDGGGQEVVVLQRFQK